MMIEIFFFSLHFLQVHILPQQMLGKSTFGLSMFLLKWFPIRFVDQFLLLMSHLMLGDTAQFGLRRPKLGPLELKNLYGKTPVLDVGTLTQIKNGKIKVTLLLCICMEKLRCICMYNNITLVPIKSKRTLIIAILFSCLNQSNFCFFL